MQATARIFFQTAPARRTKDDLCPLKLCITHKGSVNITNLKSSLRANGSSYLKMILTALYPTDERTGKPKNATGVHKDIRLELEKIVNEVATVIKDIEIFYFGQFEESFFNRPVPGTVLSRQ